MKYVLLIWRTINGNHILIGLTAACSDDTETSDELLSAVNTVNESEDTAEIVQSETSILSGNKG